MTKASSVQHQLPLPAPRRWPARLRRWGEALIELAIVVCGWSSILFVFGIFFFVFREAVPVLWGQPSHAVLAIPGANNDLMIEAVEAGPENNDIRVGLTPADDGEVRIDFDEHEGLIVVRYVQGRTTAADVCQAFAASPLGQRFRAKFAPNRRERGSPDSGAAGSGAITAAPREAVLSEGRYGLDLREFFTSPNWRPASEMQPQYGTLALLVGSLAVTLLAMVLAVPLGLGAAVFVSEFCRGKTRETLKIVIELLAAVPSVVWGFIGLAVLGPIIMTLTGATVGINLLNGGIILALMSVPIIVSVGEDALKAVPDSYREAALSLGANRVEMVFRVLFPAAKHGLLAAVLLGVGRAIGETMAVLMATGHAVQIPYSILDPIRTLTATIAAELGETVKGDEHYRVLFLIGVVLFAVTFVINFTADVIVKGIRSESRD